MDKRFIVKTISVDNLHSFLDSYKPNFDLPKLETIFSDTLELCFNQEDVKYTNVIHACYDKKEEKYCAILNIGTTTAIDDLVSINVEFLFIEKEYRSKIFTELNGVKLSQYLLQDYIIGDIGFYAKDNIGISAVSITPINEKVRGTYSNMNFITIDGSGSKKAEDWMVCIY